MALERQIADYVQMMGSEATEDDFNTFRAWLERHGYDVDFVFDDDFSEIFLYKLMAECFNKQEKNNGIL